MALKNSKPALASNARIGASREKYLTNAGAVSGIKIEGRISQNNPGTKNRLNPKGTFFRAKPDKDKKSKTNIIGEISHPHLNQTLRLCQNLIKTELKYSLG